jgi:hypothetical protein
LTEWRVVEGDVRAALLKRGVELHLSCYRERKSLKRVNGAGVRVVFGVVDREEIWLS